MVATTPGEGAPQNRPEIRVNELFLDLQGKEKGLRELKNNPLYDYRAYNKAEDTGTGKEDPKYKFTELVKRGIEYIGDGITVLASHKEGGPDAPTAEDAIQEATGLSERAMKCYREAKAIITT